MSGYEPYSAREFTEAVGEAMADQETVRMRLNGPGLSMDLRVRLGEGDELEMAGTVGTGDSRLEMIVADGRAYSRFPGEDRYRFLSRKDSADLLAEMGDLSPERVISDLRHALDGIEYVGVEIVDGVELFRYDAMASRALNAELLGEAAADRVEVDYRFWIDADDLIHKALLDGLGVQSLLRMSEWGEDVDIEAPPLSELAVR